MEEEIRCGAVGWGNVLQAGRSRVRFLPAPLMARWSTQTLTNMSTRDMSRRGGKDGRWLRMILELVFGISYLIVHIYLH